MSNVIPLSIVAQDAEPPALLKAGEYGALYVAQSGLLHLSHGENCASIFRLMEHPDLILRRWYRVIDFRAGRIRGQQHSDIVREVSAALGVRIRHDRIPISLLQDVPVRIEIATVTRDRSQKDLATINQYSTIQRIIGRMER
jgi:hypothetical protein